MIESADGFPVIWEDPADGELTWEFDLAPDVVTPLEFDLFYGPFINGFGWVRVCLQNYYVYTSSPQNVLESAAKNVDLERLARGVQRWHDEVIPEATGLANYYLHADFDAKPDDHLVSELGRLPAMRHRCGQLHELAWFPYYIGMRHLIDACQQLTGGDELSAVRLVQGYGNKSVEAGVALWRVSRIAESIPAVRQALLAPEVGPEVLRALEADPAARPFLDAFAAFLDEFGWRSDLFEFATPTWVEDPTIPLYQLRAYLEMPDYDPAREQERLAAERDEAIEETMAGLAPADRERLAAVLDVVKRAVCLQEDHNYYIDQRCGTAPRRLVLAAGRRLAERGALATPDDVFYLRASELRAALLDGSRLVRDLIDARKAEMERWAAVTPPRTIGAPRAEGSPEQPVARSHDGSIRELQGNGASAGVARGPARVLMSLAEANRLRPGDVLVARTTMPPWTPLFAAACALITETGGVLSHAAVVAREYGIPAVLGLTDATRLIRDGQLLEVDGSVGVVRVIAS